MAVDIWKGMLQWHSDILTPKNWCFNETIALWKAFCRLVCPGAYKLPKVAKEHETYAACRVPSQSKLLVSIYKMSLFEAIYGIAHNEIAVHGDSEAYSSPRLIKAPSSISNDKKFFCLKSNSANFKTFNADYVISYPIYFK